jgi:hypothetical protein
VRVSVNSSSHALEPVFLARSTAAQAVRTAAVAVPQAARKTPSIVTLPTVNANRLTPSRYSTSRLTRRSGKIAPMTHKGGKKKPSTNHRM